MHGTLIVYLFHTNKLTYGENQIKVTLLDVFILHK